MRVKDDRSLLEQGNRLPRVGRRGLHIAILAPPWITVPPPGYGGIERVVALLANALSKRGHEVALFAAPGSHSLAEVHAVLPHPHPEQMGAALFEADHVARAFAEIDEAREQGRGFDVIHDHCPFIALAMADRIYAPMVHTVHQPFTDEREDFYSAHGHKAAILAISRAQRAQAPPGVECSAVIPNPIAVDQWPLRRHKRDYLLWIGHMTRGKGPHRAIEIARRSGRELVIAGPIQPGEESYFEDNVAPFLDDRRVRYVGEVGGNRRKLLFAEASALLMPIRWVEPFGMVMVEALACGTPVIAFPEGAAAEIVLEGQNGFLVSDEAEAARAVERLDRLDPVRCRASVASRYHPKLVAAAYERVYREAISDPLRADPLREEGGALSVSPTPL